MSSQQDAQRANAGDPSSPIASPAERLVPAMEGAASRRSTSEDIRTRLNELWGRDGWIPPFAHTLTGQLLTVDSFSHHDLQALLSITNKAIGRGITLPNLYQPPRGFVYQFVRKVDGVPHWTDDVLAKAKTRADNSWKGGLPPVASVTHPRVPHSEPTTEQASDESSSDIVDLVSDHEEILPVEAFQPFEDPNEDADLPNGSVDEESPTTPLDQEQDISDMNHTPFIALRPVAQLASSNMLWDISGARAQLNNENSLSDEDVIDLIRHLRGLSVQGVHSHYHGY